LNLPAHFLGACRPPQNDQTLNEVADRPALAVPEYDTRVFRSLRRKSQEIDISRHENAVFAPREFQLFKIGRLFVCRLYCRQDVNAASPKSSGNGWINVFVEVIPNKQESLRVADGTASLPFFELCNEFIVLSNVGVDFRLMVEVVGERSMNVRQRQLWK
jgi:hypothetical protein